MPVIHVPISTMIAGRGGRHMTICTEAGIATEDDTINGTINAYHLPSYLHIHHVGFTQLNQEERNGIPWNNARTIYKLFQDTIAVLFPHCTIPIINDPVIASVDRIYMSNIGGEPTNAIQSRIRRTIAMPMYNKYVERRTAAVMALHPRLGSSSALSVTGSEIMGLVLSYC